MADITVWGNGVVLAQPGDANFDPNNDLTNGYQNSCGGPADPTPLDYILNQLTVRANVQKSSVTRLAGFTPLAYWNNTLINEANVIASGTGIEVFRYPDTTISNPLSCPANAEITYILSRIPYDLVTGNTGDIYLPQILASTIIDGVTEPGAAWSNFEGQTILSANPLINASTGTQPFITNYSNVPVGGSFTFGAAISISGYLSPDGVEVRVNNTAATASTEVLMIKWWEA